MKKTLYNTRQCVITKEKHFKSELVKISKVDGVWKMTDELYVGRSIYILSKKDIIQKFLEQKKKIRYFEMNDKLKEDLIKHAKVIQ